MEFCSVTGLSEMFVLSPPPLPMSASFCVIVTLLNNDGFGASVAELLQEPVQRKKELGEL